MIWQGKWRECAADCPVCSAALWRIRVLSRLIGEGCMYLTRQAGQGIHRATKLGLGGRIGRRRDSCVGARHLVSLFSSLADPFRV